MSTTIERSSLTRPVSPEEEDELLREAFAAFDRGDEEAGYGYLAQVPLIPSLAEFVLETKGREYCEAHFNLSRLGEEPAKHE